VRYLSSLPHRVLRIPNPGPTFNFAAINNRAAALVSEDRLLFLNDDIEVINPRWLSQMVGWSRLPGVGVVGAQLLYPDRTIQHAGIRHGFHDSPAGHAFRFLPRLSRGTGTWHVSPRLPGGDRGVHANARSLFLEFGGFDERRFPVGYNDPITLSTR